MMRSSLSRLVGPVGRAVPLIPCLAICLACATPFPVDSLEEGMTTETVRENFGAPEAMETKPAGVESSWTYVDEVQAWFLTVMSSTAFLPPCIIATAVAMPFGGEHWCDAVIPTVEKGEVVLHFEEEKLVRWEVIEPEPVPVVSSGYNWNTGPTLAEQMRESQRIKDIKHHKKGHTHHHGH